LLDYSWFKLIIIDIIDGLAYQSVAGTVENGFALKIIYSADNSRRCDFKPIDVENCQNITLSYLGDKWKGTLQGHFYGATYPLENKCNKGELYWKTEKDQYESQNVDVCVILVLNCPWDEEHGWAAAFVDEKFVKVDRDIVDCVWLD